MKSVQHEIARYRWYLGQHIQQAKAQVPDRAAYLEDSNLKCSN
jgi:hypothetical protein